MGDAERRLACAAFLDSEHARGLPREAARALVEEEGQE